MNAAPPPGAIGDDERLRPWTGLSQTRNRQWIRTASSVPTTLSTAAESTSRQSMRDITAGLGRTEAIPSP